MFLRGTVGGNRVEAGNFIDKHKSSQWGPIYRKEIMGHPRKRVKVKKGEGNKESFSKEEQKKVSPKRGKRAFSKKGHLSGHGTGQIRSLR